MAVLCDFGPQTISELRKRTSFTYTRIYRDLRALEYLGVVHHAEPPVRGSSAYLFWPDPSLVES